MKIRNATVAYFTGTGATEAYARAFAEGLSCETELQSIRHDVQVKERFATDELLVLAVPVYAGFVPPFVWERLASVRGAGSPAVLLAVYGARDYDNALHEMDERLAEKGFVTVGAAALVARHSIAQTVAAMRPDADDLAQAGEFARTVMGRLDAMESSGEAPSFSFKTVEKHLGSSVYPMVSSECVECGVCAAECPAGAIPEGAPNTTDSDMCVHCLRCIDVCPNGARSLPDEVVERVTKMLASEGATDDKPNEFF